MSDLLVMVVTNAARVAGAYGCLYMLGLSPMPPLLNVGVAMLLFRMVIVQVPVEVKK